MEGRGFSASIDVDRPVDVVYAMVTDLTRMGEWSPECRWCRWDEGAGPRVGAWFTGHNERDGREWDTHCEVVVADPGRAFAFKVSGSWIRWSYGFESIDGGTRVTESWDFTAEGIAGFHEYFGERAEAKIAERTEAAEQGIPVTLAAIKRSAESE